MAKRSQHLAWLAGAAAFASIPSPGATQEVSPSAFRSASWAKNEAILGGAPSALQAILSQQQGLPVQRQATLHPASYSLPSVVPAIVRDTAAPSAAVSSGKPDVFGSVALRVGRTPLNARWVKVENARVHGAAAQFADSISDRDKIAQLEAVNRYVNRRVQFVDDQRRFGRADVWTSADQTLISGKGDCEDYAIAKLQLLRRAGFSDRDLYLVIVKDLISRADHAVLVVRAAGGMHVLDNGTESLLDSESMRDYRPILTFAANGTWTHGYRIRSAPVQIASAADALNEKPAQAELDQRSWSASLLAFNTGLSK
jgi:predicted transglutaminase-like cysteine proteinase